MSCIIACAGGERCCFYQNRQYYNDLNHIFLQTPNLAVQPFIQARMRMQSAELLKS